MRRVLLAIAHPLVPAGRRVTRPSTARERQERSWSRAIGTPRLDWFRSVDPRNDLYGAADVLPAPDVVPTREALWAPAVGPLSQGSEGACGGAAGATLVNSGGPGVAPASPQLTMEAARDWYRIGQVLDQYPGNSYIGTTGLGIAKAGKERGYWTEYRWNRTLAELAGSLVEHGPVVLAGPWHAGMYRIGPNEPLTLRGPRVGGHMFCLFTRRRHPVHGWGADMLNSYGYGWGDGGRAFVPDDTIAAMLANGGESFVPLGRPATAPAWQFVTA